MASPTLPPPTFDAVEHFHQPEGGYRFSADSILLADFVWAEGAARAADFGAGCGVVGLCALEKGRLAGARQFFFVEREPEFLAPLRQNIDLYRERTSAALTVIPHDWRSLTCEDFGGPLDYIVVNPPYFALGSGRPSPNPSANAARREVHGSLADLLAAAFRLLAPGGRAALSLPAARLAELLKLLSANGFSLERLETVCSPPQGRERLILAEARRG